MEAPSPNTPITSDNIHLSQPINGQIDTPREVGCNRPEIEACTDLEVLEFIAAATASNTRRAYESDIAHFVGWGGAIPASSQDVAKYIAAHATTLSAATLARRIVAIRRAHVLHGLQDPTKTELVRLTFRGVRRLHGQPQRRVAPLTIEQLSAIVSALCGSVRDVRDRALLLIGFAAGAFRRSELSGINCDWIKRIEHGIVVTLPRSKTDQEGMGRTLAIPRTGGPLCPVAALDIWLQTSRIRRRAIVSAGQ